MSNNPKFYQQRCSLKDRKQDSRTQSTLLTTLKSHCLSCKYCQIIKYDVNLHYHVQSMLYEKYSSSQNYYYTRDINAILARKQTVASIQYFDTKEFSRTKEYLRRMYKLNEQNQKIQLLTEYYKYHNEIPRCFIIPHGDILAIYHDKKRNIEYHRIKNMLSGGKHSSNSKNNLNQNTNKKKDDNYERLLANLSIVPKQDRKNQRN